MWKGHWEDHPQLPDQIYLSAKERVEKDGSQGVPQQEPPELKDPLFFDSDSDGDGDGDGDDARADPSYSDRTVSSQTIPPLPRTAKSKYAVSDAELRAMALYKFEHASKWEHNTRRSPLWRDFANRPEVSVFVWDVVLPCTMTVSYGRIVTRGRTKRGRASP